MVNNLVFRWPKPLFLMVFGGHGIYIYIIYIYYIYIYIVSLALPNMFHISSCDFYVANLAQLQYREGFRICTCHDGIRLADQKACTFV